MHLYSKFNYFNKTILIIWHQIKLFGFSGGTLKSIYFLSNIQYNKW
jgi:hypothetical protein